jgi:rubrerythrin
MRVRPKRQAEPRHTLIPRRREAAILRERPPAEPEVEPDGEHVHEERMRASGGPEDNALYRCMCGFAFEAAVSTTVACPHCGTGQAW